MNESNNYVDFYSGTEIKVLRIKALLEEEQVPCITQNDLQPGNSAGFFGGTPTTVRLKVQKQDLERAKTIVESFETA